MKIVLDHRCGRRLPQIVVLVIQAQELILPHGHRPGGRTTGKVVGSKGMLQYAIGYHRWIGTSRHGCTDARTDRMTRRGGHPIAIQEIGKHVV